MTQSNENGSTFGAAVHRYGVAVIDHYASHEQGRRRFAPLME
jgi:hypothetical protein